MTSVILRKVIGELRSKNYSHVQEHCIEINRLENRIDRLYRDALGKLVNSPNDPVYIIKWKDIYQLLEGTCGSVRRHRKHPRIHSRQTCLRR